MADRPRRRELEQVVGALTEGVLLIEPDQRIVFANAAALLMHGVDDLGALGRSVGAYRANFALRHRDGQPIRPGGHPIERVLAGEAVDEAIVAVEPRGRPGEGWTHRIRSLVIADAAGRPDCLVLVIADVSDQFEAEDRFERTFTANPAPALIARLADGRIVKVNAGFLEMTGHARDAVLGRTLRDVDPLERAERRDLALRRLSAGEAIPQMEARLTTPVDAERLVIVAGQPIEVDDAACMLFTFVDLEHRRRVQAALEQSEARLATLFRLAPVPMSVGTAEGRLLDVNEAFCAATGYRLRDVEGRSATDLGLWADPEAREGFEREVAATGRAHAVQARLRCRDGVEIDALVSAERMAIGPDTRVLCAFQDISSRIRNEAELMRAIEAVMSDASWFSQAVIEKLAALRAPARLGTAAGAAGAADLTPRERDVLGRMCRGEDDPAIAAALGVSRNTVRNHVAALFRKIGVNRRSAAVVWARDRGFGEDGAPRRVGGQRVGGRAAPRRRA